MNKTGIIPGTTVTLPATGGGRFGRPNCRPAPPWTAQSATARWSRRPGTVAVRTSELPARRPAQPLGGVAQHVDAVVELGPLLPVQLRLEHGQHALRPDHARQR